MNNKNKISYIDLKMKLKCDGDVSVKDLEKFIHLINFNSYNS